MRVGLFAGSLLAATCPTGGAPFDPFDFTQGKQTQDGKRRSYQNEMIPATLPSPLEQQRTVWRARS